VRDERINCHFAWVPGYLHAPIGSDLDDAHARMMHEAAVADALGIEAHYLERVPGVGTPGVLFEHQARFHPLKYLGVLASRIHGQGSFVFEESEVATFEEAPVSVRVGRHRVRAEYLILATHLPVIRGSWLSTEIVERATHAVRGVVPPGEIGEGLYWEDVEGGYDYLRVDRHEGYDEVILGGADHEGESAAARGQDLEARLLARAPGVTITHAWHGRIIESHDGLPYIGEIGPRRFAATAYGGNGMAYGTLAGMMAADAALGRRNPWQELFDIRRTNVAGGSWRSTGRASYRASFATGPDTSRPAILQSTAIPS
jgi:glycine/D-amino acid oxidase-like deaminating enzyme